MRASSEVELAAMGALHSYFLTINAYKNRKYSKFASFFQTVRQTAARPPPPKAPLKGSSQDQSVPSYAHSYQFRVLTRANCVVTGSFGVSTGFLPSHTTQLQAAKLQVSVSWKFPLSTLFGKSSSSTTAKSKNALLALAFFALLISVGVGRGGDFKKNVSRTQPAGRRRRPRAGGGGSARSRSSAGALPTLTSQMQFCFALSKVLPRQRTSPSSH